MSPTHVLALRVLCGVVATLVIIGAVAVRAPGLGLLAVPFLVGAGALRLGRPLPLAVVALGSLVYVLISVNFVVDNGLAAAWSDLLVAYGGGPLAAAAAVLAIRGIVGRRTTTD